MRSLLVLPLLVTMACSSPTTGERTGGTSSAVVDDIDRVVRNGSDANGPLFDVYCTNGRTQLHLPAKTYRELVASDAICPPPTDCGRKTFYALGSWASSVVVTGTFTRPAPWSPLPGEAISLERKEGGIWRVDATFPAEERPLYKFVFNDRYWQEDIFNDAADLDPFGGLNSVGGPLQTFVYRTTDASVVWASLIGSFTTPPWSLDAAITMASLGPDAEGGKRWVTTHALPQGRSEYQFVAWRENAETHEREAQLVPDPWNEESVVDEATQQVRSVTHMCR